MCNWFTTFLISMSFAILVVTVRECGKELSWRLLVGSCRVKKATNAMSLDNFVGVLTVLPSPKTARNNKRRVICCFIFLFIGFIHGSSLLLGRIVFFFWVEVNCLTRSEYIVFTFAFSLYGILNATPNHVEYLHPTNNV